MTEPVRLNKKKEPKALEGLLKATNHFYDRILRAMFVTLLVMFDFVMFIYSINGRVLEKGVVNEAVLYIAGGFFAIFLILMLLLSFSGAAQNLVCGLITLLMTILYLDQFALFDVNTFIETWLKEHADFLSFIGFIPSNWLVGLLFMLIVFFAFKYSFIIFLAIVLIGGSLGIGMYKTETGATLKEEYTTIKKMTPMQQDVQKNNIVYLMMPKFPSYHFLSTIKDVNFRELRDMMIGFYAVNDFEVYPNAFVQKNDTVSNIVDIYNLVDYGSTSSGIRGYAEILNDWDFRHGALETMALEDNKLYGVLGKSGYKTSTYPMSTFNFCYKDGKMITDRCVVKQSRPVSVYDKKSSLEKNIFALLGEWVVSFHNKELKSVAKMLTDMSYLKGMRVMSENRRLSIEGAPAIFDEVYGDFAKDKNGVVYMAFAELPSDLYVYDEFCNLKPRKDWVSLKDNTLYSGGIDLKREAYAAQAKCFIGMMQMFMEKMYQNDKLQDTDIIIQGVSVLRELAGMPAGQYGTFVADRLVNLGIRKGKAPSFVVNTQICLASDVTRSHILGEKFCYSIDNMKMSTDDALNLKQNLVNNSVIRGSKISNIAADYRDWYEEFRKKSPYYQQWKKQIKQESQPLPQVKAEEPIQMPKAEEVKQAPQVEPELPQVLENVVSESVEEQPAAEVVAPSETAAEQQAEVALPQPVAVSEQPVEHVETQDIVEPAQEIEQPENQQSEVMSEPSAETLSQEPQAENAEAAIEEVIEEQPKIMTEEDVEPVSGIEENVSVEDTAEILNENPQPEVAETLENPAQNIEAEPASEETAVPSEENPVN